MTIDPLGSLTKVGASARSVDYSSRAIGVKLPLQLIIAAVTFVCVSSAAAQSDAVMITSKDEFDGPGGVRTSCLELASFDDSNAYGASILRDGLGNRVTRFAPKERRFKVRFVDWTPEILEFLKGAVDKCVADATYLSGFLNRLGGDRVYAALSPTRAKNLLDEVYLVAANTRTYEREETERRAEMEANLRQQQLRVAEATRKRMVEDEDRGYKHVAFEDFFLDHKTIPLGSKRAIKGFYQVSGEFETLVGRYMPNAPKIVLLTDSAPREVRTKLLRCRHSVCPTTVLGHTTKCSVTWLGTPVSINVCFAVDSIW